MKAWEVHPEGWTLVERAEPQPGPNEALIQIRAASLNYRDLSIARHAATGAAQKPIIPLSDGAGEVIAVGPGVMDKRVKVGQPVMTCFFAQHWLDGPPTPESRGIALGGGSTDGVLAERIVLHEDAPVLVPDSLSFEEAATLPCAAVTVWHAYFTSGHLKPGDVVLLQGTGGVSIIGLQLAKLAGARVIVTSSSDAKLARAKHLGADEVINYKTTPNWDERALALTGGAGVDCVLEVGGRETFPKSVRATRPGGVISLIGGLSGFDRDPQVRDDALARGVNVHDIYVGSRRDFEDMNRAIVLNHLRPVVDREFPFAQAREALAYLESGAHFGKVVIRV
jgi:NADPH:quinone reductase-like Zn-dependent oxidoreductase